MSDHLTASPCLRQPLDQQIAWLEAEHRPNGDQLAMLREEWERLVSVSEPAAVP